MEANLEVARGRYGLRSGGVAVCEVHRPCLRRLEERIAHPPRLIPVPARSGPLAGEIQRGRKVRLSKIESLNGEGSEKGAADATPEKKESPRKAVNIIAKAMEGADDDGWAHLAMVGHRLQGVAPDFDPSAHAPH